MCFFKAQLDIQTSISLGTMAASRSIWTSLANVPNTEKGQKFVIVFNAKTNELYSMVRGNGILWQYSFITDSWIKHQVEPALSLSYECRNLASIDCDKNLIYLYLDSLTQIQITIG